MEANYTAQLDQQVATVTKVAAMTEGWSKGKTLGSSTLYTRKYEKYDLLLARIETIADVKLESCVKYFNEDFEAQHKSKDNSDFIQEIEKIDATTKVVQFKLKGKLMVSARDFLCVQQIRDQPNGGKIIVKVNLPTHAKQVKNDAVRGECVINGNIFTPIDANKTKIESFYLMDPKGSIPASLVNTQMEKQLEAQEKAIPFMKKY
ncbi:START domain protein (macronuclear) [Tetrahymena thermophila SB210]|uniref:START domain protein n=1 Tax=Tetrahymena thermophila (strain SB210) TaxID=312017 RepID=I7M2E8_TETTS|nr:START domain protein [Tetrahymena thermophila SB210]EAS00254.3 START domain protein [Tetrahymena thermophila SB210]|eukprot:XP_001020499.3 START domain protein [Tetrahymena thermophila SB210]